LSGATLLVGLLAANVGVGLAAADGCSNAALRVGPSAPLPECRAYEMVTPVDKKGGTGIFVQGIVQVGTAGDDISFISQSAYAGAEGNTLYNRYVSTRAAEAWGTKFVDGPQAIQEGIVVAATHAVSPDLRLALTASKEATAPGAIPYGSNLYLRDTVTGASTVVAATEGNAMFAEMTSINSAPFVGASSDWSHILLKLKTKLTPDAEAGKYNLYDYSGGQLRLVAPPGDEPAAKTSQARTPNVVSADGSRFFFKEAGSNSPLFMREDGTTTVPISASERTGEEGVLGKATFDGATADGGTVFFTSPANLTDASETKNREDLYRYEAAAPAGQRLTDLTPASTVSPTSLNGAEVRSVMAISADGTYVYFTAVGGIGGGEPSGSAAINVYVWHGVPGGAGTVRPIATTDGSSSGEASGLPQYVASENGEYLAIGSYSLLTPDAKTSPNCPASSTHHNGAEHCLNVFGYSYGSDELTCLSCTASPNLGDSAVGGQPSLLEAFTYVPRGVLDDGTFYFDTPNALVPTDTNGFGDVYQWRQGTFDLLSGGTTPTASTFGDVTADGGDVYIRTNQQLVGQDIDQSLDVYDVRVEGGLAGQRGSTPAPPCGNESECRDQPALSPPGALTPASTVSAVADPRDAASCTALQRRAAQITKGAKRLAHRAKRASGHHARKLRHRAHHRRNTGKRLARRAHNCGGDVR
jgi:hypothetical protein